MKIVAVTMVRNEADIVETFARYHLQFVDELIVTDHKSGDGCSEILAALAAEEPRMQVIPMHKSGYFQQDVMTDMLQLAAREKQADLVIPIDGDEFLLTADGSDIRAALESLPPDKIVRAPWRTYVPRPEDSFECGNVLAHIQHRRVEERRTYWKVLVPGKIAAAQGSRLDRGNHNLRNTSNSFQPRLPTNDSQALAYAHFPVRSSSQLVKRHVIGYLSSMCRGEQEQPMGYHRRPLYGRLRSGEGVSPEELTAMAYAYPSWESEFAPAGELTHDPVPHDANRLRTRYDDLAENNLYLSLARFSEELAREVGAYRTQEMAQKAAQAPWLARLANWHRTRRDLRRSRASRAPLDKS